MSPRAGGLAALLVLAAMIIPLGCEESGRPPVISRIDGDTILSAGDTGQYVCFAWDWERKQLSYRWTCSQGRLWPDTGESVSWFAPGFSSESRLRVTAGNEDGIATPGSLDVRVLRDTVVLLSEGGGIKAGSYRRWSWVFGPGFEIYGRFYEVDSNAMTFLVLDDSNLGLWQAGEPYEYLVAMVSDTGSFAVEFTAPGRHHVLLDSRPSTGDLQFQIVVRGVTP